MTLRTTLLFLCLVTIFGCKSSTSNIVDTTTPPQTGLAGLVPLDYGNSWTYEYDILAGTQTSETHTVRVDSTFNFAGHQAFGIGYDGLHQYALYQDGTRLYQVSYGADSGLAFLQYPMTVGQTVTLYATSDASGSDTLTCTLFADSVRVSVPAGSFTSFHFRKRQHTVTSTSDVTLVTEDFFSRGVGLVQETSYQDYGSGVSEVQSDLQLTGYSIR